MALWNDSTVQFMKRFNVITNAQMELLFGPKTQLGFMVRKQSNAMWGNHMWSRHQKTTKKQRRKIGRNIRRLRRQEAQRIKYTIVGFKPLFAIIDDGTKLSPEMEAKVNEFLKKRIEENIWPQFREGGYSVGYEVKNDGKRTR